MPRFSVIVPVYNAADFLEGCLDSLAAQTYADFEAVCVDDGSTDSSRLILGNRRAADGRFRVVERENGGPSAARNAGIAAASGDYLVFLDADDLLEPCALERIAAVIDEAGQAEALVALDASSSRTSFSAKSERKSGFRSSFGLTSLHQRLRQVGSRSATNNAPWDTELPSGASGAGDAPALDAVVFGWSSFPAGQLPDRFVREHMAVREAVYPAFDPAILFKEMSNPYLRLAVRREALAESGVLFDETLRIGEDCQFLFALFPRIGSVRLISDKLYRYRLPRPGSLMADYKGNAVDLAAADINMAISVFGDWKAAGFLNSWGPQLMHWFVRGQLYTILRMEPAQRAAFCALTRDLWTSAFGERGLDALELPAHDVRLVDIVRRCDDAGALPLDGRDLERALLDWRIAEYGVADLAYTAVERAAGKLLDSRHMLLKGGAEPNVAAAPQACAAAGEAAAEQPLVSVIVPVYNVEKYLDQALSSLEAQTYGNIEIVCVNDGSTDSSPQIMAEYAARDGRIRIIDKENGGYGAACNRGIAEAHGTWVAILEPDDWVEPEMFAEMVAFAESFPEQPDIVKTPYWRVWLPDTPQERTVNCSYRGRIRPRKQPFRLADEGAIHLIIHHPSIWSAIYSRAFLDRSGIRFKEIPGAGWADNPFLAETMARAESIVYLDRPFYHYREETPEKTANFGRNGWLISVDRWHDMADVYERIGVAESIRRAHVRRCFTYVGLILEYHDLDAEPDVREAVKSMFDRLDPALVFDEPNVSPGSKQLFAELEGIEAPPISPVPYAAQVVKGGLYNIVNTGPAMTLDTFKGFVSAHAAREGK